MPSWALTPDDSDPTTLPHPYGALVDFTSVTPTILSDIVGFTTFTTYPTRSYHVVLSFL
jgi:hypothetical protein